MATFRSPQDDLVATTDPWVTRFHGGTQLLRDPASFPSTSTAEEYIHTHDQEVYGDSGAAVAFQIGNGGAGYTGVLRALADAYLATVNTASTTAVPVSAIAWVPNHSRHSQVALLADVVQVALTYEPDAEAISVAEGWAERVGRVFHDHFILVGPDLALVVNGKAEDPPGEMGAGVSSGWEVGRAGRVMGAIAASHERGGGGGGAEQCCGPSLRAMAAGRCRSADHSKLWTRLAVGQAAVHRN